MIQASAYGVNDQIAEVAFGPHPPADFAAFGAGAAVGGGVAGGAGHGSEPDFHAIVAAQARGFGGQRTEREEQYLLVRSGRGADGSGSQRRQGGPGSARRRLDAAPSAGPAAPQDTRRFRRIGRAFRQGLRAGPLMEGLGRGVSQSDELQGRGRP